MATNNVINLRSAGLVSYDGAGTFSASTLTQYSVLVGGASNAVGSLGAMTDGQLVIGKTGAFNPVLATLTPGTGIGITNGAGTITVNAVGGGISWTDVSGTSQAIAVNSGYTANNAGLVTLTLPVSAAYGSIIKIAGKGTGGWKVAQNANQLIHFGGVDSATGVLGYVASTLQFDTVELLCTVADLEFTVLSSVGNLTVA